MKKYLNIKSIAMLFVMFGVVALQSCNGSEEFDIDGDPENKVFINTLNAGTPDIPQNSVVFALTKTPTSVLVTNGSSIEFQFSVQCRRPAEKDIIVKFGVDRSEVLPSYMSFPEGAGIEMDKTELIIPKGATISQDKMTVSIKNESLGLFSTLGDYMTSIKVASVENASTSNLTTIPLIINTRFSNIASVGTTSSGTAISKTGWSATGGTNPARLYDGTTTTSSYATIPYNTDIILDMASVQTAISLIRFTYSAAGYVMRTVEIYTRETSSEEWKSQGTASTTSTNTNHYITFHEKVNARYIKFVFLTGANASAVRIVELYVHK